MIIVHEVQNLGMFKKLTKNYGSFENAIATIGEETLDNYCDKIYKAFCKEFENAHYLKSIEWFLRHYNSAKKVTLSSLFYIQTQYLESHNLKNITFYTCYYSLFNAFSSNLILLPNLNIKSINKISHSQIFKDIENYFVRFEIYSEEYLELLSILKLARELYSYHLPLGGTFLNKEEAINKSHLIEKLSSILPTVIQISNILSYMSYFAWKKKVCTFIDEYDKYQDETDKLFFSFIEHEDYRGFLHLIDEEDYRFQGNIVNKWKEPLPIEWFISEKMCEDLGCGWRDSESEDGFDIDNITYFLGDVLS